MQTENWCFLPYPSQIVDEDFISIVSKEISHQYYMLMNEYTLVSACMIEM